MFIALLVVALTWKGGHLTGEYAELNRHQQTEAPTLTSMLQGWTVSFTSWSWSDVLAPLPGDVATVLPPEPEPEFVLAPSSPIIRGWATHYGESYQGGVLGCGTGYYDTDNPDIIAVGPSRYADWPCGTPLRVCGPASCIVATRHDACPGCAATVLDLSEKGSELVCGNRPQTCRVTIQELEVRLVSRLASKEGP